jgi:hypothetical protein
LKNPLTARAETLTMFEAGADPKAGPWPSVAIVEGMLHRVMRDPPAVTVTVWIYPRLTKLGHFMSLPGFRKSLEGSNGWSNGD